jgi:hypothetical protein
MLWNYTRAGPEEHTQTGPGEGSWPLISQYMQATNLVVRKCLVITVFRKTKNTSVTPNHLISWKWHANVFLSSSWDPKTLISMISIPNHFNMSLLEQQWYWRIAKPIKLRM